jgi:uncharacterized membrane protein (DUF2068 family)
MQQPSTPPAGALRRPRGVTILVVLAAFRGVVGLWASIAVVGVLNSIGAGDFAILNLIWLAIAVVFLVFAYGTWNLKTWAWTLGVGLTAGSILLEAFGMLTEGQPIVGTLVSMTISAVILLFLFRPDVREAFRRG